MFIIQGEGRGHLTQAVRLSGILIAGGHEISMVMAGTSPQRDSSGYLRECFGDAVKFYRSPNFIQSRNRRGIRVTHSFLYNLLLSPLFLRSVWYIRKQIAIEKPDVILNFYDLLGGLAWLFSKKRAAYFALSHHFIFESPGFTEPDGFFLQKRLLRLHNRVVGFGSVKKLALSFDPQPEFSSTVVFPPLIRKDVLNAKSREEEFVLVYLLNDGLIADLLPIFSMHPEKNFRLYFQPAMDTGILPKNVQVLEISYSNFGDDLIGCSALITTSGFESVCEAAYLGKAVFVIPSDNHYEQHGNRMDAIRAGLARDFREFDAGLMDENRNQAFRDWCQQAEREFPVFFENNC